MRSHLVRWRQAAPSTLAGANGHSPQRRLLAFTCRSGYGRRSSPSPPIAEPLAAMGDCGLPPLRTSRPVPCVGVRQIGPFRASLRIMGRYVQFGRSKPVHIGCFRALMRRELCISGFSVHRCRKRADMHRCDTTRGAPRHRHASYATIWTFSPAAIGAPFRGKRRSSCQRIDSCYFFVFTALAFDQLE